jgi:hypothetical protein
MKTQDQIRGILDSIGMDLAKFRVKWKPEDLQLAINYRNRSFREKVEKLALKHFSVAKPKPPGILTLKPFTPEKFEYRIWCGSLTGKGLRGKEKQDERSLLKTTFDPGRIKPANLLTGLQTGESYISGEVRLNRLASKATLADARFAQTLLDFELRNAISN